MSAAAKSLVAPIASAGLRSLRRYSSAKRSTAKAAADSAAALALRWRRSSLARSRSAAAASARALLLVNLIIFLFQSFLFFLLTAMLLQLPLCGLLRECELIGRQRLRLRLNGCKQPFPPTNALWSR